MSVPDWLHEAAEATGIDADTWTDTAVGWYGYRRENQPGWWIEEPTRHPSGTWSVTVEYADHGVSTTVVGTVTQAIERAGAALDVLTGGAA